MNWDITLSIIFGIFTGIIIGGILIFLKNKLENHRIKRNAKRFLKGKYPNRINLDGEKVRVMKFKNRGFDEKIENLTTPNP